MNHSDFLSPESTVTSLLSSSGRLRSLKAPEHSAPYRYRDKEYDSASDALDAYIADFNRSRQEAGGLVLPKAPPPTPATPGVSALRNRDVLSERLTDRELDFLNLPVSSLHHRGNLDRLSMTTEELLSIPCDGSLPVTHTSAFLQGLLSQSALSRPRSSNRTGPGLDQVLSSHHDLHPTRTSSVQPAARSSALLLPRWLTSHRDKLDSSELSSVPELKYPAWIRHDLNNPPGPQAEPGPRPGPGPGPREYARSSVSQLDEEDGDQEESVTGLMVQFAQNISADRGQTSDITDHRIESLIRKADQVLSSLYKSHREAEGLLEPSGGPLGPVTQQDQQEASQRQSDMEDSRKQPGPIEALKQMLFRLQLVEAELHRQQQPESPRLTGSHTER